ncbi:hypothetical protein RHGRI_024898 [Rhododendron griersonianum]|uniref:Phospholipase/carboxylesterase/thioesterase domain-containing protein n=1 Tax=Rhododendron griersonianum TaxID=479676 RepID=A0AAV6JEE7_9ERIC|nr:hypothetical protein RHGRI_024898 [Rhododendron griersonianum]
MNKETRLLICTSFVIAAGPKSWNHFLFRISNGYAQLLLLVQWLCLVDSLARHVRCDVGEISEDSPDDFEGLDASAAHIANFLSTEPAAIKLGIGGFSMGAATALYSATCFAQGKFGNGIPYPVNLRAIVGLSGWLPGSRTLRNKIEGSHDAARRAATLPILTCHGNSDDVVEYNYGEKSASILSSAGFRYLTFKTYNGLGHYTVPNEMDEVCNWLHVRLGLDGSHS